MSVVNVDVGSVNNFRDWAKEGISNIWRSLGMIGVL